MSLYFVSINKWDADDIIIEKFDLNINNIENPNNIEGYNFLTTRDYFRVEADDEEEAKLRTIGFISELTEEYQKLMINYSKIGKKLLKKHKIETFLESVYG